MSKLAAKAGFIVLCLLFGSKLGFGRIWPNIGNTLSCVSTVFTRSLITPPQVDGFGWNLGCTEYIVYRWPRQILVAIRADAKARDWGDFLSGKQHTTLPIYGQPNFTKFTHKMWISQVVNPLGTKSWKFHHKRRFYKRRKFFQPKFATICDFWPV